MLMLLSDAKTGRLKNVSARSVRGMTLVEIVIALGVFAVSVTMTMMIMVSTWQVNQVNSLGVVGNAAIQEMAEQITYLSMRDANKVDGFLASAVVYRFGNQGKNMSPVAEEVILVDDEVPSPLYQWDHNLRAIVFNFRLPAPESVIASASENFGRRFDPDGLGRVYIYLDETTVPSMGKFPTFWTDLGNGSGTHETQNGFDINGDRRIEAWNGGAIAEHNISTAANILAMEIRRLPVDITAVYYQPGDRDKPISARRPRWMLNRRVVVNGIDGGEYDSSVWAL